MHEKVDQKVDQKSQRFGDFGLFPKFSPSFSLNPQNECGENSKACQGQIWEKGVKKGCFSGIFPKIN